MSGASGSGKTHASMVILRTLFESAGGGTGRAEETDTFKHLSASFTVLRSLGAAKTTANREASRIVSANMFLTASRQSILTALVCGYPKAAAPLTTQGLQGVTV